ncbi:HAMP domain-containing sensor histidine kinase [Actinomycetes bacterium KLBMP 9759]
MKAPAWAQTIRFRLAATYSGVLFGVTAVVLVAVYLTVSATVDAAPLDPITVQKGTWIGGKFVPKGGGEFQAADIASVQQAVNFQALEVIRGASVMVLGGLLVLSFVIGWWLAGRVLRPVRRVTAAAQEISATDLSRRIALDGPHDELRALADTVDDMLGRLDGAFTAQRQLIDDASHELRNPLAIIQTNLDAVLSRDDVDSAERRRASMVTTRATARMAGLIEDLLAAARRAAPAFTESDLDLATVASDATDEYELLAADAGQRLERRLEPGATVIGDAEALHRAVGNVVSNALRFAPRGSAITVGSGQRGGWGWIAVRDRGPGIATDQQTRVFDRFWRGGDRRGRNGLGLAIVRQVVESHGGAVALHSTPGAGATFVLWIPLALAAGDHGVVRAPTPPDADPLPTVDDDVTAV